MLSPQQRDEFNAQGFIRLHGAFSADEAAAMEDALWRALERKHGVARDDERTWNLPLALGLQKLRTLDIFQPIGGPALRQTLDCLIGAGCWNTPRYWGSFLITFPQRSGMKSRPNFHTDFPYDLPYDLPAKHVGGALVISFIGRVPANTGGTLAIAGSHRRVATFIEASPHLKHVPMKVARQALLASDAFLKSLRGEWTDQDWVAELPTGEASARGGQRLVELTGEPGDVVVGHPWLLHSPAPNRGSTPRFMTVQRIRAAKIELADGSSNGRTPDSREQCERCAVSRRCGEEHRHQGAAHHRPEVVSWRIGSEASGTERIRKSTALFD